MSVKFSSTVTAFPVSKNMRKEDKRNGREEKVTGERKLTCIFAADFFRNN